MPSNTAHARIIKTNSSFGSTTAKQPRLYGSFLMTTKQPVPARSILSVSARSSIAKPSLPCQFSNTKRHTSAAIGSLSTKITARPELKISLSSVVATPLSKNSS